MNLKKIWLQYKEDLKKNYKKKIDAWHSKVRDMGWHASSLKSFSKLGKLIETTWESIRDDQVAVLNDVINSVSYIKIVLNFLRYILNIVYNIIKIRDMVHDKQRKNDVFGISVRVFRIVANLGLIALSLVAITLSIPTVMITVAALKLAVKAVNLGKNLVSYISQKNTLDDYDLKKKHWRFVTRSISMLFSAAILSLVILAILTTNSWLFIGVIIAGVTSMVVGKMIYRIKNRVLNSVREEPRLDVLTKKELSKSYQEVLTQLTVVKEADKTASHAIKDESDRVNLQKKKEDIEKAMIGKKWDARMGIFDASLVGGIVGLSVVAIVIANPIIFAPIAILIATLFVGKIIMHIAKYAEVNPPDKPEASAAKVSQKPSQDFAVNCILGALNHKASQKKNVEDEVSKPLLGHSTFARREEHIDDISGLSHR